MHAMHAYGTLGMHMTRRRTDYVMLHCNAHNTSVETWIPIVFTWTLPSYIRRRRLEIAIYDITLLNYWLHISCSGYFPRGGGRSDFWVVRDAFPNQSYACSRGEKECGRRLRAQRLPRYEARRIGRNVRHSGDVD